MSRKHIDSSQDMFEVKNKNGLSEAEQFAIVEMYGYSIPNRPAWEQPFIPAKKWHTQWGIDPLIMRGLYNRGLVERESIGNFEWNIRLTARAFLNIDRKESWKKKLGKYAHEL